MTRIPSPWIVFGSWIALTLAVGCARGAEVPSPVTREAVRPLDVVELSAVEARDRMAAGRLSSRELTKAYLARIAALDDAGPRLDAVIELNPSALADADARDAERKAGKVRGPLHGIPVLLKDNIDVVGMVNSAGSLALAEHRPKDDAFIAARLRAAGAVILGKTNLTEWANFRSTRATSGWSSRGGQTKNPYVLDRNPCGSSAGTATAISASFGAVGVGTETHGSILCPAAVTGLVGLKPTVGLVSRTGIIPISASQDTPGPMARSVADAALLLDALVGVDSEDPATAAGAGKAPPSYTAYLSTDGAKGKRIGVLRQAMGFHPAVDALTNAALATLRARGAELVDVDVHSYGAWKDAELTVLLYEFKEGLNAYLKRSRAPIHSLDALIAYDEANAARVMPFFGQDIFEQARGKGPLTEAAYLAARETARKLARDEGVIATLATHRLDALIAPSTSPAWPTDPVLGDHFLDSGYGMASVAGTPSINVPVGETHGLPVGVTLMGAPWAEGELVGIAYALEQATRARKPPRFEPTLPVH